MLDEASLLAACEAIEGLSLHQIAMRLNLAMGDQAVSRKGWIGQAMERLLGLDNNSRPGPDFKQLGIELKTLPLNAAGNPTESTYVTSVSLLNLHLETWQTSRCWSKLKRVLWVPVEGDRKIPFLHRRVGRAVLWSPSQEDEAILARDWTELTSMMLLGRLHDIDATFGEYLQVRPKAATGKSLTYAYDEQGCKQLTLPRGFYLRAVFTGRVYRLVTLQKSARLSELDD